MNALDFKTVGSLVWTGIKGLNLSNLEKSIIQKGQISGVILFKRNIQTLAQIFELCREIHSLQSSILIMIDREGGLVNRLKHLSEYPSWPSPSDLAQICSVEEIKKTAVYMAEEIKALGICTSFAPCVDILTVENSLFKGRIWGNTVAQITKNSLAYFEGLKQVGLAACAKHFPGHGGVRTDSHQQLPVDGRDLQTLYQQDLYLFKKTIEAGIPMIMTAHILYPKIDSLKPATLSPIFLSQILRQKMNFKGLIVSDDLDMKALHTKSVSMPQIMTEALNARIDILLKCEFSSDLLDWIQNIDQNLNYNKKPRNRFKNHQILEPALNRVQKFKQEYSVIQPVTSLEKLKDIVFNSKAHRWCDTLNKRREQMVIT